MRVSTVVIALAGGAVLAAACFRVKSAAARRKDVLACSAIHPQAPEMALCLETDHSWPTSDAERAARSRQHEIDSIANVRLDSMNRADIGLHRKQVNQCKTDDDVAACLESLGWTTEMAATAADSAWHAGDVAHRSDLRRCMGQTKTSVSSCLMLYYRWPPSRALHTNDSIERARIRSGR